MKPSHGRHRALTLVEVLVSTALLAVLVSACLPLIARATRLLHETATTRHTDASEIDLQELGELADAVIADPKAYGFDELPMSGEFTVRWKEHSERPRVKVHILVSPESGSTADHHWLEFRCSLEESQRRQALSVYRWQHIELPDTDGSEHSGGDR